MDRPPLERLDLWRLRVPLVRPYRLSFGPVVALDTIVVALRDAAGRQGLGEATLLTGYTDETIEGSWSLARRWARSFGESPAAALDGARAAEAQAPFLATAFGTAFEHLAGTPVLQPAITHRVPILGLLDADTPQAIEREVDRLLAAGYRTLKLKVGFEPDADAARVSTVQSIVAGRARLRIDANQGYDRDGGRRFVRRLDPRDIELFEQPCAAGDWAAHVAVARESPVPMMVDESVYGEADIERAAELRCAAFVKVKLMKFGRLARLVSAIERIVALGMQPVLGNGVAHDLGCWMEACAAVGRVTAAGEMNGFLKPVAGLLARPLRFADGAVLVEPGFRAELDRDVLARFALDSLHVDRLHDEAAARRFLDPGDAHP